MVGKVEEGLTIARPTMALGERAGGAGVDVPLEGPSARMEKKGLW